MGYQTSGSPQGGPFCFADRPLVLLGAVAASGKSLRGFTIAGSPHWPSRALYTLADRDDVLDVNVRGVAYGVQAVYPVMRAQGSGHIINTASMAGLLPTGEAGSYVASKHAVVGLSKVLRVEAKPYGVRVSAPYRSQ